MHAGAEGPNYDNLSFSDAPQRDDSDFERDGGQDRILRAYHPEHGQVGHLSYSHMTHSEFSGYPSQALHVDMLRVNHEHRRRGIATQMMEELERRHHDIPIDHGTRTRMGEKWGQAMYGRPSKPVKGPGHEDYNPETNKFESIHFDADWTLNGKPWSVKGRRYLPVKRKTADINQPHWRDELIKHAEGQQDLFKRHGNPGYGPGTCHYHSIQEDRQRHNTENDLDELASHPDRGLSHYTPVERWDHVGQGSCGTCTRHQNEALSRLPGGPHAPLDGPRTSPERRPRDRGPLHPQQQVPFDPERFRGLGPSINSKNAVQQPPEGLGFTHEERDFGGTKYPVKHTIFAHVENSHVGHVEYLASRRGKNLLIQNLYVDPDHQRKGIGSALMDEMQRRHPGASIDHGERTDEGKEWWNGYSEGKPINRGRTSSRDEYGTRSSEVQAQPWDGSTRREGNRAPNQVTQELDEGAEGPESTQASVREVSYHPAVKRDLKKLDPQIARAAVNTIQGMTEGTFHGSQHPLNGPLAGWNASHVRGFSSHRITYRNIPNGPIQIGHVGPHNYDQAVQRLRKIESEYPADEVWYHASQSPTWQPRGGALHVGTGHAAIHREDSTDKAPTFLHRFRFKGDALNSVHNPSVDYVANHAYHEAGDKSHSDQMEEWDWDSLKHWHEHSGGPEPQSYVARHVDAAKRGQGIYYHNVHEGNRPTVSLVAPDHHFEHLGVEPISSEHRSRFASLSTGAADEIGRQEHPNVDHYQSGGLGHLEGDESRSVVGFMPVKEMQKYREHDGDWNGAHSEEVVHGIRQDIRDGKGIHTPLTVHYSDKDKWAYIGEGNHRLRAATEEGLHTVPVRVVRREDLTHQKSNGIGAPLSLEHRFNERDPNYVPSDIHPYHFIKQAAEDYWMNHRPGGPSDAEESTAAPAHDLTKVYPPDVYDKPHFYGSGTGLPGGDKAFRETVHTLRSIRGNPEARVTMYRSLPKEHAAAGFHTGDWVSIHPKYAEGHGLHPTDPKQDMPVIKATVPAKHLWNNGDSLDEFGYHGPPIPHEGFFKEAKLSDEDRVSVAEEAMERGGLTGRNWHVPNLHQDDPAREGAHRDVHEFVNGITRQHGVDQHINVIPKHWDLRGGGKASTDGLNYIGLSGEHTNDMELLHEVAHVINRTGEGQGGHGAEFQKTLHGLYRDHLGPEAADTFAGITRTSTLVDDYRLDRAAQEARAEQSTHGYAEERRSFYGDPNAARGDQQEKSLTYKDYLKHNRKPRLEEMEPEFQENWRGFELGHAHGRSGKIDSDELTRQHARSSHPDHFLRGYEEGLDHGFDKVARFTPTKRVFAHTCGLDHRLWDKDEHLKPDVRKYILRSVAQMWTRYNNWSKWSIVYFAGSEASEWTSPELEGNNDFDVLIGVDYDKFREDNPNFASFDNQQITDMMNTGFRPYNGTVTLKIDGAESGPWDRTTYVNPESYDITRIKPYAAYNVSDDKWTVKPPHLPHWSLNKLPIAIRHVLRAADDYANHVLALPEPERTQQGAALFDAWHSDRNRAFSEKGEGWWDIANLREKWLDQEGTWAEIVNCKHRAKEGLDDARADWSNTPKFGAIRVALVENRHWGQGLDSLFPEESPTTSTPFKPAGQRKDRHTYDKGLVARSITHPEEFPPEEVDPRILHGTQPKVLRAGVKHYMEHGTDAATYGENNGGDRRLGNDMPRIYHRLDDDQHIILSGHHRAAAQLLKGEPLKAIVLHGGWGESRG